MLQKQENKQYQDLVYKSQGARETQERKFDYDMQVGISNPLYMAVNMVNTNTRGSGHSL